MLAQTTRKESIRIKRCVSKPGPFLERTETSLTSTVGISYSVHMDLDPEFMELYNKVKTLVPGYQGSMKEVLRKVLGDYESRNCPQKRQTRREQRKSTKPETKSPIKSVGRSAISREVRDRVYLRDRGQCTYVSPTGTHCSCRENLQVDHVIPAAKSGSNNIGNLRLLCRSHNLLMAEKEFGKDFMFRYTG